MADFEREKAVECMFDPVTSSIIAALEDGEKECSELAKAESIPEAEVLDRLSYLIQHGLIIHRTEGGRCILAADTARLTALVEDSGNFEGTISGLEKMDSYLN